MEKDRVASRAHSDEMLVDLLDRIAQGLIRPLTLDEVASLRDYVAGKFRRKPGQSPRREYDAAFTAHIVGIVRERRRANPKARVDDVIDEVVSEWDGVDREKIANAFHRSRQWSVKRKKFNKLK